MTYGDASIKINNNVVITRVALSSYNDTYTGL